ncbi:putative cytochrome c oxidase subunit 5C-4 [Ananas comosus]|uniref:Putative cytochrome c oxidase subunit 5C-4 n=1 Tax=Ananas comosus TaxID=4615 RepID=A0A199UWW0_ANACO|nr:putative cytochrome c oxidase subunit 5C-4 [Ananas comosus]
MSSAQKIASHAASRRPKPPPNVVKEMFYGISLGLFAGYLWKLHHWNNQRRTREFYQLLDQGKISVVGGGGGDDNDRRQDQNRRENIN